MNPASLPAKVSLFLHYFLLIFFKAQGKEMLFSEHCRHHFPPPFSTFLGNPSALDVGLGAALHGIGILCVRPQNFSGSGL